MLAPGEEAAQLRSDGQPGGLERQSADHGQPAHRRVQAPVVAVEQSAVTWNTVARPRGAAKRQNPAARRPAPSGTSAREAAGTSLLIIRLKMIQLAARPMATGMLQPAIAPRRPQPATRPAATSVIRSAGLPRPSTPRYGHIRPKPRAPAIRQVESAPSGMIGAMSRKSAAPRAGPMPCRKALARAGAASHTAAPMTAPMTSTGPSAIRTILRISLIPPMARARDIQRVSPVSAPSPIVLDRIVNSATSSKNSPVCFGCSQRLARTVRPRPSTAPVAIAVTLTKEPRATTPASFGCGTARLRVVTVSSPSSAWLPARRERVSVPQQERPGRGADRGLARPAHRAAPLVVGAQDDLTSLEPHRVAGQRMALRQRGGSVGQEVQAQVRVRKLEHADDPRDHAGRIIDQVLVPDPGRTGHPPRDQVEEQVVRRPEPDRPRGRVHAHVLGAVADAGLDDSLGPGVGHAMAAPDEVDETQVDATDVAQQQGIADMFGRIDDDAGARDLAHGRVQALGQRTVGGDGRLQGPLRPQAGQPVQVTMPVHRGAQRYCLAGVDLVPPAERGVADLIPERAVVKALAAAAAIVAPHAPLPDEDELAHGPVARHAGEDPLEQGAAAARRTADVHDGRARALMPAAGARRGERHGNTGPSRRSGTLPVMRSRW